MNLSLKQLQKQNVKLREAQSKIRQMESANQKRMKLMRENKALGFRLKHKGLVRFVESASSIGKSSGKAIGRTGLSVLRGLNKWGQHFNEMEMKQRRLNRRLSSKVRMTKRL